MSFRGKAKLDEPVSKSGAKGGQPLVGIMIGGWSVHENTYPNVQAEVKCEI